MLWFLQQPHWLTSWQQTTGVHGSGLYWEVGPSEECALGRYKVYNINANDHVWHVFLVVLNNIFLIVWEIKEHWLQESISWLTNFPEKEQATISVQRVAPIVDDGWGIERSSDNDHSFFCGTDSVVKQSVCWTGIHNEAPNQEAVGSIPAAGQ